MMNKESSMEFAGDLSLQLLMTYRMLHYVFNNILDYPDLAQHYQLLFVLTRMGGSATQMELINYLKAGESTIRASINVLEEKGYVTREKHNKHNRTLIVKVTEKTSLAMPSLRDALRNVELIAFRSFNEDQLFQLWSSLIKINNNCAVVADAR